MLVNITLKDPDGVYDDVIASSKLSEEDKDFLIRRYFDDSEYLYLVFDTETKTLSIKPRS